MEKKNGRCFEWTKKEARETWISPLDGAELRQRGCQAIVLLRVENAKQRLAPRGSPPQDNRELPT